MDDDQLNVIKSSSKSQDLEALNNTSLWEGKTVWSTGESQIMNGAWLERGRWHQTVWS